MIGSIDFATAVAALVVAFLIGVMVAGRPSSPRQIIVYAPPLEPQVPETHSWGAMLLLIMVLVGVLIWWLYTNL